ncbi:hypothetical protein H072_7131 [Dactylellina haptotyla CBS 200.50]|uniref:ubiquitinyl hydrolase 1 n=1 Tax=Dactylellina haptotyla (strain CBS 200.50) TaxID=1284197 RepID=S8BIF6_DACHA|nr:hypothetical protein H072_7131 [Dactylellina haptotyla CBS 200.50]
MSTRRRRSNYDLVHPDEDLRPARRRRLGNEAEFLEAYDELQSGSTSPNLSTPSSSPAPSSSRARVRRTRSSGGSNTAQPTIQPSELGSNLEKAQKLSKLYFQILVNNVFLPPKLPDKAVDKLDERGADHYLLTILSEAARSFGEALPAEASNWWQAVIKNVTVLEDLYKPDEDQSGMSEKKLLDAFASMRSGDFLTFYIRKQNAGLVIRRTQTEGVFETFEASPLADGVAECRKRLKSSFPGPRTAISKDVFDDPRFRECLLGYLGYMDATTLDVPGAMNGSVNDAGATDPSYMTHVLTGITRGIGELKPSQETKICKRIADAVLGTDKSVWRRSPMWLVIRVGLQTTLKRQDSPRHDWYKLFLLYFMSKTLQIAMTDNLIASDFLYIMGAKIARRAQKLDGKIPLFVNNEVSSAVERLSNIQKGHWEIFCQLSGKQITWSPIDFNFEADCELRLPNSLKYLKAVAKGSTSLTAGELDRQNFEPSDFLRIDDALELPLDWSRGSKKNISIRLMDIETWVEHRIDEYVVQHAGVKSAVIELGNLFAKYLRVAVDAYAGNPENLSLAFLTGYEIWVALDKIAVQCTPLLADYPPEIRARDLDCLLVPSRKHMKRLAKIQVYVMDRERDAKIYKQNILNDSVSEISFQCRYFDESPHHEDLLAKVQITAAAARRDVLTRCDEINDQYFALEAEKDKLEHVFTSRGRHRAMRYCERCQKKAQMKQLRVARHEWPLPKDDEPLLKTIIFELHCPEHIAAWRDTTFRMLVNTTAVLQFSETHPETKQQEKLSTYIGLKDFYTDNRESGIVLASLTKAVGKDGGVAVDLPADNNDILAEFSLRLRYWYSDGTGGHWVHDFLNRKGIWNRKMFSYKLPRDSLYRSLEFALMGTVHMPNQIEALQYKCPPQLSIHEFREFGMFRSGHNLQWLNIARTLKARSLNLNHQEVSFLFLQASWEAGPAVRDMKNIFYRDSHRVFDRSTLTGDILNAIEGVLESIQSNWLEIVTMVTLIALSCRCLSLIKQNEQATISQAIALILKLRDTVYRWIEDLREKVKIEQDENTLAEKLQSLMRCAAVCRMTYEVPEEHADYLVDGLVFGPDNEEAHDPKQIAIYLETAAIIRDNLPLRREHVEPYFRHAIDRSNRISHRWESRVRDFTLRDASGIDLAIEKQWQKHERSTPWAPASDSSRHWLHALTKPSSGSRSVQISVNLLDGQFLIDSVPFGRLPDEYIDHATIDRIFGGEVVVVCPSSMSGMQFETRFPIQGHQVHFALKGTELIVRSKKDDELFELIPHTYFDGDLCAPLVDEFSHWMSKSDKMVQFRKLADKWSIPNTSWVLKSLNNRPSLARYDDPKIFVIDPRSRTANQVHGILSCLEPQSHILVTAAKNEEGERAVIQTELARLNLKFATQDEIFTCHNFSGFAIDSDQTLGCFNGLVNKLVLRKNDERMVIVPSGDVIVKRIDDFTQTVIDGATSYRAYAVNRHLGRLVGDGSISSRLYQAYLHAVTSSPACQVDKLTQRTGTEEAASLLLSGAVKSFQELNDEDIRLLHLIAQLTPRRTFGASQRRENHGGQNWKSRGRIEYVAWNNSLSFNCQRDIFRVEATSILDHWMKVKRFIPTSQNLIEEPVITDKQADEDRAIQEGKEDRRIEDGVERGENMLLRRAACRNEVFYPFIKNTWSQSRQTESHNEVDLDISVDYEDPNPIKDMDYSARDGTVQLDDDKEPYVCQLTKSLLQWTPGMQPPNLWTTLKEFDKSGVKGSHKSVKIQVSDPLMKRSSGEIWCGLFSLCRKVNQREDIFKLVFALGALTYRDGFDPTLVHALAAAAMLPEFRDDRFEIPAGHIEVEHGAELNVDRIQKIIKKNVKGFSISHYNALPRRPDEPEEVAESRRRVAYNQQLPIDRSMLLQHYKDQGPTDTPSRPNPKDYRLINVKSVHRQAVEHLQNVHGVYLFKLVIDKIQGVLDEALPYSRGSEKFIQRPFTIVPYRETTRRPQDLTTLAAILEDIPAPSLDHLKADINILTKAELSRTAEVVQPTLRLTQLQSLHRNLIGRGTSEFQRSYADDLKDSIEALKRFEGNFGTKDMPLSLDMVKEYLDKWKGYSRVVESAIRARLDPTSFAGRFKIIEGQEILYNAGLWPRITIFTLMRLLSFHTEEIPSGWKRAITEFGIAIRELSRAERLLEYATREDVQGFWEALADTPELKWEATQSPDWLLLELENGFCMRDVQAEIAKEMIHPSSEQSSVMQLNMGEGKSSVIIPAVAASLADGQKLVRVVVLKPLSREMFNLLRSKLGGLCSRRIYYLPFHRGLKIEFQDARQIQSLYEECMKDGGIFLVQNEHLLSFKLLGLEKMCTEEDDHVGLELCKTQAWLHTNSRDLLDESDEILRVNHTLVYTVGTPRPMDNQPYRWLDLLKIFDVVKFHALELQSRFPQGLEIAMKDGGASGFPYLRILQLRAANALVKAVATTLVFEDSPGLQWFTTFSDEKKKLIHKYISERNISKEDGAEVKRFIHGGTLWGTTLLCRGLLVNNILQFCLQEKRWRVDYGADFNRTLLAVPYKAKDTPSTASDFAHPDVLLCLTSLSWYNYGLDDEQIKYCLEFIYMTENPEDEYSRWIFGVENIPPHLRSLKGVNPENVEEFSSVLCPVLKYNKAVIDFYLGTVVFPAHTSRYPYKLNSSGWDLVERKTHLTSGFSGTNDNKYLLQLSIQQQDLESHKHTNALVLNYILAQENNHFIRATVSRTRQKMTVEDILDTIVKQVPPISVLLDVGAQVLELDNQDVAKQWLVRAAALDSDKWQAAVFFNSKDEICVIDCAGRVELLMTSNFAKKMANCLCYLDDAHTRGTDLKFPLGSRALVTLGPKTTKDRLIQGAMRMRKLGKGHSLAFCAPLDIETQILAVSKGKTKVESVDILKWALRETCRQTRKNAELWAVQGINYLERSIAQSIYNQGKSWSTLREILFEPERLSLEDLYGLEPKLLSKTRLSRLGLDLSADPTVQTIRDRCKMFDIENFEELGTELDQEQEREVEQEVETEREIQPPPPANPLPHILREDLKKFIRTGTLSKNSTAVGPAILSLQHTSLRSSIRPGSWSTRLLVTKDFADTVEMLPHVERGIRLTHQDKFVRPVTYILSSNKTKNRATKLVIISPFEAHQLLDDIKKSKHVHLHIYMPKVTKSMESFEDLRWMNIGKVYRKEWSIPAVLMDQLNLFAGQLYFRHHTAYLRTAEWLSLRTAETDPSTSWDEDGFLPPGQRVLRGGKHFESTFKKSPIPCIQDLAAMRRKGFRYDLTHLGQLLHGKLLQPEEFCEADSDLEGIFNEGDNVSADGSDSADYIKDEDITQLRSTVVARHLGQVYEERREAREETAAAEENAEEGESGEESNYSEDSLPRVKTEPLDYDSDCEIEVFENLNFLSRSSSPVNLAGEQYPYDVPEALSSSLTALAGYHKGIDTDEPGKVLGIGTIFKIAGAEHPHCAPEYLVTDHLDDVFSEPSKVRLVTPGSSRAPATPNKNAQPAVITFEPGVPPKVIRRKIHFGTIASGTEIVRDKTDAAGFTCSFPYLVFRGISDYADSNRNELWQNHAAIIAAAVAKQFLQTLSDRNEPSASSSSHHINQLVESGGNHVGSKFLQGGNFNSRLVTTTDQDIIGYLNHYCFEYNSVFDGDPDLKDDARREVIKGANGIFLFAKFCIDYLRNCNTKYHVQTALSEIGLGKPPCPVADFYEGIIRDIEKGQTFIKEGLAMKALSWVVLPGKDLSVAQLHQAISIRTDLKQLDTNCEINFTPLQFACHGLLEINTNKNGLAVYHMHDTARQYLRLTIRQWFPKAYTYLISACLTYLSFDIFKSGPCLTQADYKKRVNSYPIYECISQTWGTYARSAEDLEQLEPNVTNQIIQFLKSNTLVASCTQALLSSDSNLVTADTWNQFTRMNGLHVAAYLGLRVSILALPPHKTWRLDARDIYSRTPIDLAAENGHLDIVKVFLSSPVLNRQIAPGLQKPLQLAATAGHIAIVKLLLFYNANIDGEDKRGKTPLHLAVEANRFEMARLLLNKGASIEARDLANRTPLLSAVERGNSDLVSLLLKNGADIEAKDVRNRTPLLFAAQARTNNISLIEILLKYGADLEAKGENGQTPLFLAIQHSDLHSIQLLLNSGARLEIQDHEGLNPLFWAWKIGSKLKLGLLLSWKDKCATESTSGTVGVIDSPPRYPEPPTSQNLVMFHDRRFDGLTASEIVAKTLCQDTAFRQICLEALTKIGRESFNRSGVIIHMFFQHLTLETVGSTSLQLPIIWYLWHYSEVRKVMEEISRFCIESVERGKNNTTVPPADIKVTIEELEIPISEDKYLKMVASPESGNLDLELDLEDLNLEDKSVDKLLNRKLFFYLIKMGNSFRWLKFGLRLLTYPAEIIKKVVQTGNIENTKRLLEIFWKLKIVDPKTSEYSWTLELYHTGYSTDEIAKIVLDMEKDGPCIFFESRRFEGFGTEIKVDENSHANGCAHRSLMDWDGTRNLDIPSGNLEIKTEEIQELCGLAGITPISTDQHTLYDTEVYKEDHLTIAKVSYASFDENRESNVSSVLQKTIDTLERLCYAAGRLQLSGQCCSSYTAILRQGLATEPVTLHAISFSKVAKILGEVKSLKIQNSKLYTTSKATILRDCLSGIFSLFGSAGAEYIDDKTDILQATSLAVQFLSLSFLSYSQAHMGPIQTFFLDVPVEKVVLTGFRHIMGKRYCIRAELATLTCVGDMLANQVLAFTFDRMAEDTQLPIDPEQSKVNIIATPEDILDTWGPGNFIVPKADKSSICAIRLCGGYIHGFCEEAGPKYHWSSAQEVDFLPKLFFKPTEKLEIGALVQVNRTCVIDKKESWNNSLCAFENLDVHGNYWELSEIQIGLQAGSYAVIQANNTREKKIGKSLKQKILEQEEWDLVHFLDSLWGLQVSSCTGVARRVSLQELIADMLEPFMTISLSPEGQELWRILFHDMKIVEMFHRTIDELKSWLESLPQNFHLFIFSIIRKILHNLQSTWLDPEGKRFSIAWLYNDLPRFRVQCDDLTSSWLRILADSEDCATFAYIQTTCMETDQLKCWGPSPFWQNMTPVLQTAIFQFNANTSAAPAPLNSRAPYFFQKMDSQLRVTVNVEANPDPTRILVPSNSISARILNIPARAIRRARMNNRATRICERPKASELPLGTVDVFVSAKDALVSNLLSTTRVHLTDVLPSQQMQGQTVASSSSTAVMLTI